MTPFLPTTSVSSSDRNAYVVARTRRIRWRWFYSHPRLDADSSEQHEKRQGYLPSGRADGWGQPLALFPDIL